MTQKAKMILIGIAAVAVAAGFVAGVAARGWYDRKYQEKEDEA